MAICILPKDETRVRFSYPAQSGDWGPTAPISSFSGGGLPLPAHSLVLFVQQKETDSSRPYVLRIYPKELKRQKNLCWLYTRFEKSHQGTQLW